MTSSATRLRDGAIGVGYEGQEISEFIDGLVQRGVTRLVDVRLTPISRKRGFSKTALRAALAEAGIEYDHRRELGNLKTNRAGFAGDETELKQAKDRYVELLENTEAQASLDELARLSAGERVAVLCFEADQRRCHRDVVLAEIAGRLPRN
ncbi:Hypothetical protein AJAP_38095 [Amycolatopsis japonica]|uniref:DUF488 domain-containing protein n=1 Tax=Amycolatopsis japonica TaxID=208439 RepID=A0A075V7L0_9PSEU|nr:DUF488 domain-containing protein [Amycolatopsis japonica]AIG80406.1 Hypothetical protein AJAP_38095 [Amycolatopsis japonica]